MSHEVFVSRSVFLCRRRRRRNFIITILFVFIIIIVIRSFSWIPLKSIFVCFFVLVTERRAIAPLHTNDFYNNTRQPSEIIEKKYFIVLEIIQKKMVTKNWPVKPQFYYCV